MNALEKLAVRYPQKRVLITGATSGLGEALALRFAGGGFRVAVASRNPEKVKHTVQRLEACGSGALPITLDVTREEDFHAALETVETQWGGLDILVNNAGVLTAGKVQDIELQAWQQALDTDLWSVIHGCRIFIPLLIRSGGGHIVNVASAAGLVSAPDMATYNVAKAGVVSLSETLKVELADQGIDVTVSCPTVFKSHLLEKEGHQGDVVVGVTARGLQHDMETTHVSSDSIAVSLLVAMAKRRLYDTPQWDAKLTWFSARLLPETFRAIILYLYRHRLWVFNDN